jgi:hypothetical protein
MSATGAQKSALKWLRARGGDGVFATPDRQVLLAAGERAPVMRSTWTRLIELGLVEGYGSRRLRVSEAGRGLDLAGIVESGGEW